MTYMKHPKLKRKKGESEKEFYNRQHRYRARARKVAREKMTKKLESVPLKIVHDWIADRDIHEPHIVLRIDDYMQQPAERGQFYTAAERTDDKGKAIWPNREMAQAAAEWAVKTYGRQYGIFKMVAIAETQARPVRVVEV